MKCPKDLQNCMTCDEILADTFNCGPIAGTNNSYPGAVFQRRGGDNYNNRGYYLGGNQRWAIVTDSSGHQVLVRLKKESTDATKSKEIS